MTARILPALSAAVNLDVIGVSWRCCEPTLRANPCAADSSRYFAEAPRGELVQSGG